MADLPLLLNFRNAGGGYDTVQQQSRIDEGSSGAIYLYRTLTPERQGQQVVVKHIKTMYTDEADMYQQIGPHPFLLPLLDHTVVNGDSILFLPYCANLDLFQLILQRGRLEEQHARYYMMRILLALEHLHQKDIVHGDIKPENILLDEWLNVYVADFGLSVNTRTTKTRQRTGTPAYMAPETLVRTKYIAPPVDVWSAGIVLVIMLTGRHPFHCVPHQTVHDDPFWNTCASMVMGFDLDNFLQPFSLSADTKDLLSRMLDKVASRRITATGALQHSFFRAAVPLHIPAGPLGPEGLKAPKGPQVNATWQIAEFRRCQKATKQKRAWNVLVGNTQTRAAKRTLSTPPSL